MTSIQKKNVLETCEMKPFVDCMKKVYAKIHCADFMTYDIINKHICRKSTI